MKWYFYLHYFIYRFYKKKKDNMPVMYSLGGSVALLYFNIMSISVIYQFFTDFWTIPKPSEYYKIEVIAGISILALINYVLLYRKKKYIEIFDEFQKNDDEYKKWDSSAKWYIILSIATMLIVLIVADMRNHNFEWYFLK